MSAAQGLPTESEDAERCAILDALRAFAERRPGLDPRDYGGTMDGWRAYRSDSRSNTRDLQDVRELWRAATWRAGSIRLADVLRPLTDGGRLSWNAERRSLSYTAGQYYATEYRGAVAAALASMLWAATCANHPDLDGDGIRARLRAEFGPGIARRYFN